MTQRMPYDPSTLDRGRNHRVGTAVSGGMIVAITGNRQVAPAGAAASGAGWVPYDQIVGELVPVHKQGTVPCLASANIAAGQDVITAANGAVAPIPAVSGTYAAVDMTNTRAKVGQAEAAITSGQYGPISLSIA